MGIVRRCRVKGRCSVVVRESRGDSCERPGSVTRGNERLDRLREQRLDVEARGPAVLDRRHEMVCEHLGPVLGPLGAETLDP